jgi:hypothetical protein
MRFTVLLWAVIELIQIAVIAFLAVGYRDLRRNLKRGYESELRQPRSVTEE